MRNDGNIRTDDGKPAQNKPKKGKGTMAKMKMTAKQIREADGYKVELGYCEASHLLSCYNPVGYTCGVYGWNFDVYHIIVNGESVWICTGYRGMVGERLKESVAPYEEEARKILSDWSTGYSDKRDKLAYLIDQWLTKGLGL